MAPQPSVPRKKARRDTSSTPLVESPSFVLPESGQPPPSNFFRGQQALLGHVGVVAGLKPATLANRSARGENAENPIVVEEENPTALAAWKATSRLRPPLPNGAEHTPRHTSQPAPDPGTFAIVPEIFVGHGSACDVGCCTGNGALHAQALRVMEKSASEPPTKRRRLDLHRPRRGDPGKASAEPLSSMDLQQMVRKGKGKSKKMLLHVLTMLKDALEQGSDVMKEDENSNAGDGSGRSHYRPKTAMYGIDVPPSDTDPSSSSADAATMNFQYTPNDPLHSWEQFAPSDDFASYGSSFGSPSPYFPSLPEHISTSDLESWLSAVDGQLCNESSAADEFGSIFNAISVTPTPPTNTSQLPQLADAIAVDQLAVQSNAPNSSLTPVQDDFPQDPGFTNTFPIDPTLLALSAIETSIENAKLFESVSPSKDGDVIGSMELMNGDFGLDLGVASDQPIVTPMSQMDSSIPQGSGLPENDLLADLTSTSLPSQLFSSHPPPPQPTVTDPLHFPAQDSIGTSAQDQPFLQSASTTREPLLDCSTNSIPVTASCWTVYDPESLRSDVSKKASRPYVVADRARSRKAADKEAIISMAKQRREALAIELARAKIELWETTIEQGVLLNMLKDKELDVVPGSSDENPTLGEP
ncbi:hypothetical protein SCHPADRAFT_900836 [Schizopora paradoxa]|uniref:Uncharacterized protein n=1 Tax=Schizopora paradoxa TaxID=27342 RepID=A0A0H2RYN4_9AGAM|nr:hypothetical protein SCHPADRAFT_900836 [Schizopora paradoxa]